MLLNIFLQNRLRGLKCLMDELINLEEDLSLGYPIKAGFDNFFESGIHEERQRPHKTCCSAC